MPSDERTAEELELENRVLRRIVEMKGADPFNGLPRWVRVMGIIGFPAFIALYFLARDAGYVPSVFTSTSSQMTAVQHAMLEQATKQEQFIRLMTTGLRVICINDAGSDAKKIVRCQDIQ